jgi:hypothetical protein
MTDRNNDDSDNPMHHPEEQPYGSDQGPQFGRLLVVLGIAVVLIGLITWVSVEVVT